MYFPGGKFWLLIASGSLLVFEMKKVEVVIRQFPIWMCCCELQPTVAVWVDSQVFYIAASSA